MAKKSFKKKLLFGLYRWWPVKNNTAVFKSFDGLYSDNPKYISEKLHEMYPDIEIVWGLTDKATDVPEYVKKVDIGSKEFAKISATAKILVDNMSGMQGIKCKKRNPVFDYFIKRNKQYNISTWHGTPLKKIGCDIKEYNASYYQSSARYITAGNDFSYKIFKRAFNGINIKNIGTARNDVFFKKDTDRKKLKQKLGLPEDKEFIIYAPTFRRSVNDSGLTQMKELDVDKLLKCLKEQFGGEWCLVLRFHPHVFKELGSTDEGIVDNIKVFDGNIHNDMGEYLMASSALLTDYSSSMFDYMLGGKPCFLYAHDREHYMEEERGGYMKITDLPYKFADNIEELYSNIKGYNKAEVNKKEQAFLDFLGNKEDGESSLRVVKDIAGVLGEKQ